MKLVKNMVILCLVLLLTIIMGCSSTTTESTDSNSSTESNGSLEANSGGELRIALNAQPPTLDPQASTATATRDTGRLIFESLLVLNSKFEPVPFLAEKIDNEDNQKFTFHLRKGVKFHNGQEMTAEDVVASMNRWKGNNGRARQVIGDDEFKVIDKYTVSLELSRPSAMALNVLADHGQFAAIMPKEIVEAAGPDGVNEYIGTGPFKLVKWDQDVYIHFTKYADYQPIDVPMDGLYGKKEALVDDIYFYIAKDASTRFAGVLSGEYDIAYQLPFDSYEDLKSRPNLKVNAELTGDMVLQYNAREGLLANPKMRQAINAALNMDEVLQASLVNPDIYKANTSYIPDENKQWATNAGSEYYNQKDIEKAKRLLAEAGYNGEEITFVTTRDYAHYYDSSVVIKEQLESIGMKVNLEVYDWPTLSDLVKDSSKWNMRVNGFTFKPDPTQILYLNANYAGAVEDATVIKLLEAIELADSNEVARTHWEELQEYLWAEFLPITKLGSYSSIYAMSDQVEGFTIFSGAHFWNVQVNN